MDNVAVRKDNVAVRKDNVAVREGDGQLTLMALLRAPSLPPRAPRVNLA